MTYLLVVVSFAGSLYTFKNYQFMSLIVVETVDILAPTDGEKTIKMVESNLSKNDNKTHIINILKYEQSNAIITHKAWLNQSHSQQTLLRNQLILWLAVHLMSLVVLIALYRKRNAL